MAGAMADPAALERLVLLVVERLLRPSRAEAGSRAAAACGIVTLTRMVRADPRPEAVFDDGDRERVIVPAYLRPWRRPSLLVPWQRWRQLAEEWSAMRSAAFCGQPACCAGAAAPQPR